MKKYSLLLMPCLLILSVYFWDGRAIEKKIELNTSSNSSFFDGVAIGKSFLKEKRLDTEINIIKKLKGIDGFHYFLIENSVYDENGANLKSHWLYKLDSSGSIKKYDLSAIEQFVEAKVEGLSLDDEENLIISLIHKQRAFLVRVHGSFEKHDLMPIVSARNVLGVSVKRSKTYVFELNQNGADLLVYPTFSELSKPPLKLLNIPLLHEVFDIEISDKVYFIAAFIEKNNLQTRLVALDEKELDKIMFTPLEPTQKSYFYRFLGKNNQGFMRLVGFTRMRTRYSLFDVDVANSKIEKKISSADRLRWFDTFETAENDVLIIEVVKQGKRYELRSKGFVNSNVSPIKIDSGDAPRFYRRVATLDADSSSAVFALIYAELDNRTTFDVFEIVMAKSVAK